MIELKPAPFVTETGEAFEITEAGSLGLLAYGYSGILLWRQHREAVAAIRRKAENNAVPPHSSSENPTNV